MRQASVDVFYKGTSITADISPDVVSFSYTDNAEGTADDISLTIANVDKKWLTDWTPQTTDKISAKIQTIEMGGELDCGLFVVDTVSYSGRPLTVSIKGLSMPADTNFSEVAKSKSWQKITLKDIAQTMSDNSSIALKYSSSNNPTFDFISQVEKSDKSFLYDLCCKFGLNMKLYSNRLIIYDPIEYEINDIIAEFHENDMLSWSCESTLIEAGYSGCRIQYTDPTKATKIEYTYTVGDGASGKVYEITTTADSLAHAEQICKAKLRSLNMSEQTISFSVMGNAMLVACVNIAIAGLGAFDGKYFVDKVTHKVGGGYITSVEAHLIA